MNSCNFIGYLAKDPEIRVTHDASKIANFTVGVNRMKADAPPVWIPCTAFGKLAETCEKYLKKGMKIAVTGRMDADDWKDKDGVRHYQLKVIVDRFDFFQKKDDSTGKNTPEDASSYIPE